MPDCEDKGWCDSVLGALSKSRYQDLLLILAMMVAFSMLMILSTSI